MPTVQEVKFKRKTTAEIEDLEIEDGALIYNVENGKTYMDYGNDRIPTGGGANGGIYVGEDEPQDPDITLWVDTPISETKASEIVNEYTESDKVGYSTNYINNLQKIIYENNSGDDTDIICTENPNNFDYLQFDFLHQDYHASSIVPLIDNKIEISSIGIPSGNTILQLINQRYTINGSTLEFDVCGMVNILNKGIQYQDFENVPTLHIKKVIGIKK